MRLKALTILPILVGFLAACSDSPTDLGLVGSLELDGPVLMYPGQIVQVIVSVLDGDGEILDGHAIDWSSSAEEVASVDGAGVITALQIGTTTISAAVGHVVESFTLHVEEDPCAFVVGQIPLGGTVEGELTEGSCFLDSWFHDPWFFALERPVRIQIDLISDEFDPFLILTDSFGNEIAGDDDSGEGNNARLTGELPEGSYLIWASSVQERETGSYEITVIEIDPEDP